MGGDIAMVSAAASADQIEAATYYRLWLQFDPNEAQVRYELGASDPTVVIGGPTMPLYAGDYQTATAALELQYSNMPVDYVLFQEGIVSGQTQVMLEAPGGVAQDYYGILGPVVSTVVTDEMPISWPCSCRSTDVPNKCTRSPQIRSDCIARWNRQDEINSACSLFFPVRSFDATMIRPAPSLLLKYVRTFRNSKLRNQINAYLFLLPALIIFALFSWYPIITTIVYSFQKVGLTGPSEWVGLQNYTRMFGNPVFVVAWKNVLGFVGLSIVFGFIVPIILALMINEMRRFGSIFQVITYIPTLVPIAIALLIWRFIYAPEGGVLNSALKLVNIVPQLWLQDPNTVKLALIIIMTWLGAGGSILIYLAALKEINPEVYEAAELDGVSPLNRIIFITLPLLK